MYKTMRWTIILAAMLSGNLVSAQVGLLEIYRLAEASDPILRQAEANYLATRETKPQARSSYLPNISVSGNSDGRYSESGPFGFGGQTFFDSSTTRNTGDGYGLSISQPIFNLASLRQLKQADKVIAQAELNLESTRQELLVRVAQAYFNVLSAEELLAAETASREAIGRQLEQAQRRFEVGLIAITDVQQAQAAYDNATATEIGAQRSLASTQEFLREIIGEYVTNLRGPGEELPLLRPNPESVDEWVSIAMEQNLVLASSRIGTDIAQDEIGILRAARFPTLDLSGGYNDSQSESRNSSVRNGIVESDTRLGDDQNRNWAINLRVPLYTGGFNASRSRQAVYQHRASQQDLERVARQTERETRDAYLGVIAEISRVEALRQAVESNRTALRATEAGFEVGTQTTVDVLAAQDNLRRAETNFAISRYDYIINLLNLRRAAGNLAIADFELVDTWFE